MKGIKTSVKLKAIKLFLGGDTLDEIAKQLGIAKGSVVKIIEDFRNGILPIPPGMTEYIDALRHIAVDIKKSNTMVAQVLSCQKLHERIAAKGVSNEKVGQWLDIVESIATSTVSNEDFVQAALELGEATAKNGKSYNSVVQDCKDKQVRSEKLDVEIENKEKAIALLDQEHYKKVEHHSGELKTIINAIETAQAAFESQKQNLAQHTEELMHQKNLTFAKVNTVSAILNTELGKVGLEKEGIHQVTENIAKAGSLTVHNNNLEDKRHKLEAEIQERVEKNLVLADKAEKLQMKMKRDEMVILGQESRRNQIDAEIKSKGPELDKISEKVNAMADVIYQAQLITAFLVSPKSMKGQILDDLVRLLLALRQKTLGTKPKEVKDASGRVLWECPVPIIDTLDVVNVDIDNIRINLAMNLVPLVKEHFVPLIWHKAEKLEEHALGELAMLNKLGYPTT
jgi:hypothetical protein